MRTDKHWLFWFRHGPFGTSHAREGLDALLVMAAFDQNVSVLFERDALPLILSGRDCQTLVLKDFCKGFAALDLYGVKNLYYHEDALYSLGCGTDDLGVAASPVRAADLATFIRQFDHVLSF
jgi:tRNA 2-thiouridine synthesizing protein C